MRLKEYLNESKEVSVVRDIISPRIKLLYDYLKSNNWEINDKDTVDVLNILFKTSLPQIIFKMSPVKSDGGYKNIVSAEFDIEGKSVIVYVYLPKNISDFFNQFIDPKKEKTFKNIKKNEFLSDLENMLSHEFRHLGQLKSSNLKIPFINPEELDPIDFWKYLASDAEIDAFSYQASIEYLKTGKNGVSYKLYNNIFNPDKKNIEKELATKKDRSGSKYKSVKDWLKAKDKIYKNFLTKYERYKKKLKEAGLDKIL